MDEQPSRPRTLEEVKGYLLERLERRRNPLDGALDQDVRPALERLTSTDPDHWVEVWTGVAKPYEEKARGHESRGEGEEAHRSFMLAYNYYRLARFPCPNTPAKREAAHDGSRIGISGSSFGGYWSAKAAHTESSRLWIRKGVRGSDLVRLLKNSLAENVSSYAACL